MAKNKLALFLTITLHMTEVALPKCEIHSTSAGGHQILSTARNEWNINKSHNEKERKKISISEAKLER